MTLKEQNKAMDRKAALLFSGFGVGTLAAGLLTNIINNKALYAWNGGYSLFFIVLLFAILYTSLMLWANSYSQE